MDIYPRLSRLWRDFGIFSVTTSNGCRSKLRDSLVDFVSSEYGASSFRDPNIKAGRFAIAKLVTGRPKDAALGIHLYLGVPDLEIWRGMSRGVQEIADEFARNGTAEDQACLQYVLYERGGSSKATFQEDLMRDCDGAGQLLSERCLPSGEGMELADFVAHPFSRQAKLLDAHVLALRLYTTAAFRSINNPLRKGQQPHPLPITVAFLADGVRRLRATASSMQGSDEPQDFWRGMRNIEVGEGDVPESFLVQGGTEQAPMSTSEEFDVGESFTC